jgi:hypothetical protein
MVLVFVRDRKDMRDKRDFKDKTNKEHCLKN